MKSFFSAARSSRNEHSHRRATRRWSLSMQRLLWVGVVCVCIPALLGGGIYAIFFTRLFLIESVEIHTQSDIDQQRVRQEVYAIMDRHGLLPFRNLIFFPLDKAQDQLESVFAPSQLAIRKRFPRTLLVTIEGRPYHAYWYASSLLYPVNREGKVLPPISEPETDPGVRAVLKLLRPSFAPTTEADTSHGTFQESATTSTIFAFDNNLMNRIASIKDPLPIPLLFDRTGGSAVVVGSIIMQPQELERLEYLHTHPPEHLSFRIFRYQSGVPEVEALTNEGWIIKYSLVEDPQLQLTHIEKVLRELIKKKRKQLEMIDVRFPPKVFYTFRNYL